MLTSLRTPVALAATLVLLLAAGPDLKSRKPGRPEAVELPPLNESVIAFAREQLGKKVGNGECTALVVEAFRNAGARRFPLKRSDGDFVWGRPVATFRESLPGDVVQFRDAVFQGKTSLSKRRWFSWRYEYPHHSAIVAEVRERGDVVTFLHQNVGAGDAPEDEKKRVQEVTLRPGSLQKGGKLWIYRPVGRDEPLGEPEAPPPEPSNTEGVPPADR
jgi:hypothetical protein